MAAPDVGPSLVAMAQHVTVDQAFRHSVECDSAWRREARRVERLGPAKAAKRQKRAARAHGHLIEAIFWRVLAVEHQGEPGTARIADLEGPRELAARVEEAKHRALLTARAGEVKPGRERGSVDHGSGLGPADGVGRAS